MGMEVWGRGDSASLRATTSTSRDPSSDLPFPRAPHPNYSHLPTTQTNHHQQAQVLIEAGANIPPPPTQRRLPKARARQRGLRDPAAREGEAQGAQEEAGRAAGAPAAAVRPHVSFPFFLLRPVAFLLQRARECVLLILLKFPQRRDHQGPGRRAQLGEVNFPWEDKCEDCPSPWCGDVHVEMELE